MSGAIAGDALGALAGAGADELCGDVPGADDACGDSLGTAAAAGAATRRDATVSPVQAVQIARL